MGRIAIDPAHPETSSVFFHYFTLNIFVLLESPTDVVTTTGPVVAPMGTVHVILVSDHESTLASTPLNVKVDVPWSGPKYLPDMATPAPFIPDAGPRMLTHGPTPESHARFPWAQPLVLWS